MKLFSRERGSLNLEMALLISLLVLAAVGSLSFIGLGISNQYNKAGVLVGSGTNFAADAPVVVENDGKMEVTWGTTGATAPYSVYYGDTGAGFNVNDPAGTGTKLADVVDPAMVISYPTGGGKVVVVDAANVVSPPSVVVVTPPAAVNGVNAVGTNPVNLTWTAVGGATGYEVQRVGPGAATIASDDFNDADNTEIRAHNASWLSAQTLTSSQTNIAYINGNHLTVPFQNAGAGLVSGKFWVAGTRADSEQTVTRVDTTSRIVLIGRYAYTTDWVGYVASFGGGATGSISIKRYPPGAYGEGLLAINIPAGYTPAVGQELSMRIVGNRISVYVDGEELASVTDNTFTSAGVNAFGWFKDPINSGLDNYRLYNGARFGNWVTIATSPTNNYSDAGLASGTYRYRIRSVAANGTTGQWSSVKTVVIP